MVTAAGCVACSVTIFGFLGKFWWFFDLFSHFRVQYLGGLCVLSFLLLLTKRRNIAFVFLLFAGINLSIVLPLYFGQQNSIPLGESVLKALLINVNTRFGDVRRVIQVVGDFDPDIIVLEEINSQWVTDLKSLSESYPYSKIQPREDNFGIGIFSKVPMKSSEIEYIGQALVPSIVAVFEYDQTCFKVIAAHPLPPDGAEYSRYRNDQLEKLGNYVDPSLPVMLLGDLNVTPWNHYFQKLLNSTCLKDSSQGYGIQPTWPSNNPLLLIPLDHCLHSQEIKILQRRIGPNVGSDHYPLMIDFVIKAKDQGESP
jgi:endonuclease/exonuclease/phosphatase (EEP) superfamily protein YafD